MSYEIYKVLHVICVILFMGAIAIQFFTEQSPKSTKIISGITSFLILVGGMGLLARLGIGHGESWPLWVKVKLGIWLVVAIGSPVLIKRLTSHRHKAYYGFTFLVFIAVYMAVNKVS